MYNPHVAETPSTIIESTKKLCPTCKGAGKQITNFDGSKPSVFGKQNSQGVCPNCMGKGFSQPVKWYRHAGGV